jgi:hypothetical protein
MLPTPKDMINNKIIRSNIIYAGFEVLTAVVMRSSVLWDIKRTTRRYIHEDRTPEAFSDLLKVLVNITPLIMTLWETKSVKCEYLVNKYYLML